MRFKIKKSTAKNIWIHAQRLDEKNPFGSGSAAVNAAVAHLGYVQIDTINVIERCHHHILYNRIPEYQRVDLHQAQAVEKRIFEYWTHALSYISVSDYPYFIAQMQKTKKQPPSWFASVTNAEYTKVKKLILKNGPLTIRDIKDDELVEKTHPWGSSKPSKRALQLGFYRGEFVVSERVGIVKKYDLAKNHFNWQVLPKALEKSEYIKYISERALRSQGFVSLDSICYLDSKSKKQVESFLHKQTQAKKLVEIEVEGLNSIKFWMTPESVERKHQTSQLNHILSPFDPLIIQRKRLSHLFDYDHLFEAYIPKEKRKYGYFALPVMIGNNIAAVLDLKADRQSRRLLINNWIWLKKFSSAKNKKLIEQELNRFAKFQFEKLEV